MRDVMLHRTICEVQLTTLGAQMEHLNSAFPLVTLSLLSDLIIICLPAGVRPAGIGSLSAPRLARPPGGPVQLS